MASLALAAAASAFASAGDPRVCATVTPDGPSRHSFYCAQAAAVTAVRSTMAARQHQSRWFFPVSCSQAGGLLRWACVTSGGGQIWRPTVVFARTASGWRTKVVVP